MALATDPARRRGRGDPHPPPASASSPCEVAVVPGRRSPWRRWEHLCLLGYMGVVAVGARFHTYWADELQSWLTARDASLWTMFAHQLRRDGNPGLWHLLLWLPAHAHLPLLTMSVIAGAAATAAVALFLYCSPFPALIRGLFPFTFFAAFQYAVVARPYTLLAAAAFGTALAWRRRLTDPVVLGVVLMVLSLVAVQGMLMAAGVAGAHALDVRARWSSMQREARGRQLRFALMLVCFWALAVIELYPSTDAEFNAAHPVNTSLFGDIASAATITNGALGGWWWLTVAAMAMSVPWLITRRRLSVFLLPALGILGFGAVKLHSPWHEGFVLFAWILALWIALDESPTEARAPSDRRGSTVPAVALGALLAVQAYWAAVALIHSTERPYAPEAAAAAYLKAQGMDRGVVYGAVADSFDAQVVAINAYFDGNIIRNYHGGQLPGYFTYSLDDLLIDPQGAIHARAPEVLLIAVGNARSLGPSAVPPLPGYIPVAYFGGSMVWKDGVLDSTDLMVERRADYDPSAQTVGGCPDHCGT